MSIAIKLKNTSTRGKDIRIYGVAKLLLTCITCRVTNNLWILTVLVYQHPNRYPWHVKTIQEILYAMFCMLIDVMGFFQLQNSLRHRFNHIGMSVSNLYQIATEMFKDFNVRFFFFKLYDLVETLYVPVIYCGNRWHT